MIITSFLLSLVAFVAIGVLSIVSRQPSTLDYLLAGRDVKPSLVGLSFFATENSGFMFVGFVGLAYVQGVSAVWFLVGWYVGEVAVLWRAARKVREKTGEIDAETYGRLLSEWSGTAQVAVRRLSALVTMVLLGVYAAAQLSAGGKALHVLMGWEPWVGVVIGFVVVLLYCFAGGIRATIWTDAAQGLTMLVSLVVLVVAGLSRVDGYGGLWSQLSEIDPGLVRATPEGLRFGFAAYFAGWLFAGAGVLGQPHVMVRFMVIDNPKHVRRALLYYLGMVGGLTVLCLTVGLVARVVLPELGGTDPELALPALSRDVLPDVVTGLVLAGLFAASMSTADSQVLSGSAALAVDLVPRARNRYGWTKMGTVLVALCAVGIALLGSSNVFALMTFAWATMAAGFGPILFLHTFGLASGKWTALAMMVSGPSACILWKYYGYPDDVYMVLPGLLASFAVYCIGRFCAHR